MTQALQGISSMATRLVLAELADAYQAAGGTPVAFESVGGVDGLLSLPGVAQTPAARDRRVVVVPDGELLNFGPRTPRTLAEIARQLRA